jgi:hypothetical protein
MIGGVGPTASRTQIVGDSVPSAPPPTVAETTTTTTTTSTTTTSTTTTTLPPPPSPVPLSVSPSTITVGPGGTAQISGTCPTSGGAALGPVQIWQVGQSITVIPTGVAAAEWSFDWTAPGVVEPLVLQVWCGDPTGYTGGYPAGLQVTVVFVAQEPPATTTTVARQSPPVIPATG